MAASSALLEVRVNELTASNEADQRALIELRRSHEAIVKAHAAAVVKNGELQRTNGELQRINDALQRKNDDLVSEGEQREREESARRAEEEDTELVGDEAGGEGGGEGGDEDGDLEVTQEEILLKSPGAKEEEKEGTEVKDGEEEGPGSEHEDEQNKKWESELITSLSSEGLSHLHTDDHDDDLDRAQGQDQDAKLVLVGTAGAAWDGSDVASAWQLVESSGVFQGIGFGVRLLAVGATGFALMVLAGIVAGSMLGAVL